MQIEEPWHGRQFCAIYLDLVKRWMGPDAWARLKTEFRKRNVKYRAIVRAPSNPVSEEAKEALRKQSAYLNKKLVRPYLKNLKKAPE